MNRKALGKGLEALIPDAPMEAAGGLVRELRVREIRRNEEQPRSRFDDETIAELAASIRTYGVIQPVVVRQLPTGVYQVVAGERRLRAARLAGLEVVPAIVRDVDETGALELALVENLQREDLNPIDEAHGYESLMELSGATQADVSERVGRGRSTVANALRLLELPPDVQEMLSEGALSAGHGRALLGFGTAEDVREGARKAVARGLSVRELEALSRGKRRRKKSTRKRRTEDPVLREWEERLQRTLGTQVRIERMGIEGTIRIEYYSDEDLERILEVLGSLG
ncbi:MAG: ParB/RepB/Spo0J family partition protein [Candidatus Eisenbacteria sp.]|nr:ParB/RepB/Spo0J family partition protein [Candidatus Eisenbacteria bacterium]MCK5597544.1 ParB/RepB/Spo0J family partition protein [Candidatus Eisenbacteria bacterium]